jgi:hypothetical protein
MEIPYTQVQRSLLRLHYRCATLHKLMDDGTPAVSLQGTAASSLVQLMNSIDGNGFFSRAPQV